jgi:sugar lactone lactonase YvrE
MKIREIASGLQFPEGPIAMDDGSVLLVEIARGTLTRVTPEGPTVQPLDLMVRSIFATTVDSTTPQSQMGASGPSVKPTITVAGASRGLT